MMPIMAVVKMVFSLASLLSYYTMSRCFYKVPECEGII